jgi:membrane associated rhomboid family serine protease
VYGRGYRSPGFGFGVPYTPPIVKQLLIANAVVFVLQLVLARTPFTDLLAVSPQLVWQRGFLWQPFTYMWLHGGLAHIGMNCFVLWMFGSPLALAWGPARFLRYYLLCGVGAGFVIASWPYAAVLLGLAPPLALRMPTLGASGAIFGVLLGYSITWPERTIMLIIPPVAFRAIWLIPVLFVAEMILDPGGNISHIGHLGGVLVGWIYLKRRGDTGNLLTWGHLKYRWRRFRMRQRLRAVRVEDLRERRRRDDHTLH